MRDPSNGGMQNHDVFTLGEFKDDCLQEHYHNVNLIAGTLAPGSYNSVYVTGTQSTNIVLNVNSARKANVTRGKRMGALICIRAE